MASPYREGYEAYFEGRSWEDCPYFYLKSDEPCVGWEDTRDEWMNGWDDAEFEMKGKKNESL